MLKDIDTIVYAFSDGSAIGNPGPGGYGAVLKYGENVKEFSQGFVRTTNNRMELLGAITALDALKGHQRVVLTTDSQYVINGIEKALDAGCDDYDTKPINLEGLLDKMHKLTV